MESSLIFLKIELKISKWNTKRRSNKGMHTDPKNFTAFVPGDA
jgi:hypothetical protein